MTIRELAKIIGTSPSTVSKALNDAKDVSEETKIYIRKIAGEYGYMLPETERILKTDYPGPKIALIFSDIQSSNYSRFIDRLGEKVRDLNGLLYLFNMRFSREDTEKLCLFLGKGSLVDGMILLTKPEHFSILDNAVIPVVGSSIATNMPDHKFDNIFVDGWAGAKECVGYLTERGHRRFALIGEKRTMYRMDMYKAALQKADLPGIQCSEWISGERFKKAGYEQMRKVLASNNHPTAVLCTYDDIALGAAEAILEAGYRIPEDFSLVGVDNIKETIGNHKLLSSIDNHIEEQGDIALRLLLGRLKRPESAVQLTAVQTDFRPNETVGAAASYGRNS